MAKKPRLLMISFDAVGDCDLELLLSLPNFSRVISKGTLKRRVDSIFITNTYPIHASIQTGVLPMKHGIIDNDFQSPFKKHEKWRFHIKHLRVPSLPSEAEKQGLRVCTLMFPVTGASPAKYNLPEMPGKLPFPMLIAKTLTYGKKRFILQSLLGNLSSLPKSDAGHGDNLVTAIGTKMLLSEKADLIMLHLLDVDVTKHRFGATSQEAQKALDRTDERLGILLDALEKSNRRDETSVLIFSDHSCMDVHTAVHPNDLLKEAGISLTDAFFHCSHGCCFLKMIHREREPEVLAFLQKFSENPAVARALTDEEMRTSGADQEFFRGFAAAAGFVFGHFSKGQHGYTLDHPNYQVFYTVRGPGIPEGILSEGGSLLDVCPLAVDILGMNRWPMDGENRIFGLSAREGAGMAPGKCDGKSPENEKETPDHE